MQPWWPEVEGEGTDKEEASVGGVLFDPEAGEAAIGLTQAHAASALPPNQWETSLTEIVWTVRYHPAKGLTPVRPQVVLKDALVLKAGEAVKLELV